MPVLDVIDVYAALDQHVRLEPQKSAIRMRAARLQVDPALPFEACAAVEAKIAGESFLRCHPPKLSRRDIREPMYAIEIRRTVRLTQIGVEAWPLQPPYLSRLISLAVRPDD